MGHQTFGNLIGWNVNKYWKWVDQDQASKEVRHQSLARTNIDRKPYSLDPLQYVVPFVIWAPSIPSDVRIL